MLSLSHHGVSVQHRCRCVSHQGSPAKCSEAELAEALKAAGLAAESAQQAAKRLAKGSGAAPDRWVTLGWRTVGHVRVCEVNKDVCAATLHNLWHIIQLPSQ